MVQESIKTTLRDKIATISFFSSASNSLTSNLLQQLSEAIDTLSTNKQITVIILQSEGTSTFCAGASFDELLLIKTLEEGEKFFSGFANVINAMRKSTKIIVGRIQGKAVGGGVGLISACDYAMGTLNSSIKLSEISIGIGPFVIEPAVHRKTNLQAFTNLTLNPDKWFEAQWAKQNNLFNEVFDTIETLDNGIETFTQKLSLYNPNALVQIKKTLWNGTKNWDDLLQEKAKTSGELVLSEFTKNALKTFKK